MYTQGLNVKVTLSLGRETEMCIVGMLVWAERAAGHVDALYANIPKSFQKHKLPGLSIPPETMMHFPPMFQISPLFSKNFQTLWKIFSILPFPEKILHFHPPKFLMTFFLVIDHKFRISPYFPCFSTFPPCFAKIIICPPNFQNFPPV